MDSTQTVRTPECTWPLKGPSRVRMEAWRSGCFTNPKLHARRFLWTRGGLLMEASTGLKSLLTSRLPEHVLVLGVADDQRALAIAFRHHQLYTATGVDGDERGRPVVVLARGDLIRPLAEVEHRRGAVLTHCDLSQLVAPVAPRQLPRQHRVGGHHQPLALLGDGGLPLRGRHGHRLLGL